MKFTMTNRTDTEEVSSTMSAYIMQKLKHAVGQLKEKNQYKESWEMNLDIIINLRDTKLQDQ